MFKAKINTLALLFTCFLSAQAPQKPNSAELYNQLQKINFFGKVLYIAAHPDDENTKLITYFANKHHAETTYLSLTRGDGGQNLIGAEMREKLGAIRTQELLAARRTDGGKQFFTRANDFGYSKTPNETFTIWNKEQVLADVVQLINTFQPDIIVNRFDHRTPGTTHGHHTASALLSLESYDLVKHKPQRVFFNTSWWFFGSQEKFEAADKSNFFALDINEFYPTLGKSNNEIAALSRSQHRCQGFGTMGSRDKETEYLELLKGDLPKNNSVFDGINTTWSRIEGGEAIGKILDKVAADFNFKNPAIHIHEIVKAYQMVLALKDSHWKTNKTNELRELIKGVLGLYLEANTETETSTRNSEVKLKIEALNRSNASVLLKKVSVLGLEVSNENSILENTKALILEKQLTIPNNQAYSNLFWLEEPFTDGMYSVANKDKRNLPEEQNLDVNFTLEINGVEIIFTEQLVHKFNTPENGETFLKHSILPEWSVAIKENVVVFDQANPKEIEVTVTANQKKSLGVLKLNVPKNWSYSPKEIELNSNQVNSKHIFTVTPPLENSEVEITAEITNAKGERFTKNTVTIDYPHIPKQTLLETASFKAILLNLKKANTNIGYLMGAGDDVGKQLESLGYTVTYLDEKALNLEQLTAFNAILLGIRAFNTNNYLAEKNKVLFDYVKQGGNLIVQYNTSHRLVTNEIAPYPLSLSRDRITDEKAKVLFLKPEHPVMRFPNQITTADFNGWVQEQGLYYPNKWDKAFTPILESNDPEEEPLQGALLIAPYGKGNYMYTGLSFFRELPAGVSGAIKLLANCIALPKNE